MARPGPVLALIPAKGGSTRLRRKNILPLGGRPLIGWAIEAARAAGVADAIVVSTEDAEIAAAARELGAEVPFLRPDHLARDPAGVVDVALHALAALREAGREYATLIILLPTCPFRSAEDVRAALELFRAGDGRFLMSVSAYPHTPFAALELTGEGLLSPYFPEYIGRKSQEMPKAYRANGALHVLDVAAFETARSYYAQPLLGYVMPEARSVDIDTEADLRYAEFLLAQGGA
ncbi:MAG: acylneuraminate cytidylyltransferase family protein [Thiobacillaceae bacterium]|jgi:CMP-N-acetylneuraminic acid synthetase|nr:acylneuraminate cytidylyltransferase family protein [Thiobacillaceae bacterium]